LKVGEQTLSRQEIAPRGHAQRVLPMVDDILAEAGVSLSQLDGIAFDRGPGAFTGIRIGTSVVQGLAFGADLPVIPVSSLCTLAQGTYRSGHYTNVLAVIDARMQEVYWAYCQLNDSSTMELIDAEHVSNADRISVCPEGEWYGAGTGWQTYAESIQVNCNRLLGYQAEVFPLAKDVISLAEPQLAKGLGVSAEQALPVYIRDEVAWKKQTP